MVKRTAASLLYLLSLLFSDCESESDDEKLPGPFEVTIGETDFTSASIEWTSSSRAESYEVYLETEKVPDTLKDNSIVFSGLEGEVSYGGRVVAINAAGKTIVPFTFTTTVLKWPTDHLTFPKMISVLFRRFSGFPQYDYSDSLLYEYVYGAENRLTAVTKHNKRYACTSDNYLKCTVFQYSITERFEFEYLSRRLIVRYYDKDNILKREVILKFNNNAYILPDYAGIKMYDESYVGYDSVLFYYDENRFLEKLTYYEANVFQYSSTLRNHGGNLYMNAPDWSPADSLSVDYSDFVSQVNQYSGLHIPVDPDGFFMATDVLFFPTSIFRSSGNLATKLTPPGPGSDEFVYIFSDGTMTGFQYSYSDLSTLSWEVSIEY